MGTKYTVDNTGIVTITNDLVVDTNVLKVDTSNDRVGIGTASPGSKFEIYGDAGEIRHTWATNTSYWQDYFYEGATPVASIAAIGTNFATMNRRGALELRTDTASGPVLIKPNTTETVRFMPGGNVGIGTTTPGSNLDVYGTSSFGSSTPTTISASGVITAPQIKTYYYSDVAGNTRIDMDSAYTEFGYSSCVFTGGNLGVGLTAPNTIFHVKTTTDANFHVFSDGVGVGVYSNNDLANAYVPLSLNGSVINLNGTGAGDVRLAVGGGNVGIGTVSPGFDLDVVSSIAATGAASPSINLKTNDANGDPTINWLNSSGVMKGNVHYEINGDNMAFGTAGVRRMTLNASGLGVGISSPSALLHVYDTDESQLMFISYGHTSAGSIDSAWANGFYSVALGGITGGVLVRHTENLSTRPIARFDRGASNPVLWIGSDDAVGVMTTTPQVYLHVGGTNGLARAYIGDNYSNNLFTNAASAGINIQNSSTGALTIEHRGGVSSAIRSVEDLFLASNGSVYFESDRDNGDTTSDFVWRTNASGTELMRLTDEGYLGIGTAAPGYLVHLVGSSPLYLANGVELHTNKVYNGIGSADMLINEPNSGRYLNLNGYAGIVFKTNGNPGTEKIRIDSVGSMGIGTNSPDASSMLDVTSTTKGILPPRMTEVQRDAIGTPATGLLVYNTTTNRYNVYTGASWSELATAGGGGTPTWAKYTKTYANLSAAALTNDIELFSAAAGTVIHGVKIKHSTAFSGGAISAYTVSVGISGTLAKYASAFDVFQATGNTTFQLSSGFFSENHGAATSVRIAATSVGANLDQAAAGSVDVWVLTTIAV